MSFAGARIVSFESRRAAEMAELIRINGGDPLVAPSLVEVPLEDNESAFAFAQKLQSGDFDMVVFLTGSGARALDQVLKMRAAEVSFKEALRKTAVVARGPKPSAVLREWNVPVTVSVPEPSTWREILAAVEPRSETRIALQEYGRPNPDLLAGLKAQGRHVTSVPVYRWKLPEDTAPLQHATDEILAGKCRAALFTTGVQADHLLDFAGANRGALIGALQGTFVASIGPDCSEALRSHGIAPDFEPSHPKMGILVREAAAAFAAQGEAR